MSSQNATIRSKFRGSLLGLTIGDALAFPFRGRSRTFLSTKTITVDKGFAKHDSGYYPPGQFSDDSQTALKAAEAIIESREIRGQILAEHLIPLWRDQLVIDGTEASGDSMEKLLTGKVSIANSAQPMGRIEADALARAVPVGLWCHSNPDEIPESASIGCSITHSDPCIQAVSAGMAAAISYNLNSKEIILGVFLDQLSTAIGKFHGETAEWIQDFPRILSITELRVFEQFREYCCKFETNHEPNPADEIFHSEVSRESINTEHGFNDGVPDNGLFVFLEAIYYFLKSPFNFKYAMKAGLGTGGEVTTLCALVGALGGALLGEDGLPDLLGETVLERQKTLSIADALYEAWSEKD